VPSLYPQLASSHSDGVTVRTESHDSKCTISEVAMRETVSSDEHAAAGSLTLGMMVTVPRLRPWSCHLCISQSLLMLPLVLVVSV
jgi:hypothetical protein